MSDLQPSLFDDGVLAVDRTFASARRVRLDAHSWVEHVPGWLSGSLQLFEDLLGADGWQQRDRRMYDEVVAEALSDRYDVDYDGLWMNLYRDHRDSTGWHGDAASCRRTECVVPVLSLGADRRFLLRPTTGGAGTVLRPVSGDLVVMGGRCQTDWRHSVPKQAAPSGPRISVNYRAGSQAVAD